MINTTNITLNDTIIQTKGHIVSDMDGEKILMSISNSKYYNLGVTGGRIWELIDAPISLDRLVTMLVSEYEIDRSDCVEQVMVYLERLLEDGLVEIHTA